MHIQYFSSALRRQLPNWFITGISNLDFDDDWLYEAIDSIKNTEERVIVSLDGSEFLFGRYKFSQYKEIHFLFTETKVQITVLFRMGIVVGNIDDGPDSSYIHSTICRMFRSKERINIWFYGFLTLCHIAGIAFASFAMAEAMHSTYSTSLSWIAFVSLYLFFGLAYWASSGIIVIRASKTPVDVPIIPPQNSGTKIIADVLSKGSLFVGRHVRTLGVMLLGAMVVAVGKVIIEKYLGY